jgi:hypothetical protein
MSADLPDDEELLAAELAFGLLDAAERRAAEARLGSDPAFADAHARWQRHASVMFEDRAEAPGAHVWDAIEARVPANDPAPEFRLLRWWRAGTFAAAAVALALGIFALQNCSRPGFPGAGETAGGRAHRQERVCDCQLRSNQRPHHFGGRRARRRRSFAGALGDTRRRQTAIDGSDGSLRARLGQGPGLGLVGDDGGRDDCHFGRAAGWFENGPADRTGHIDGQADQDLNLIDMAVRLNRVRTTTIR